MIDMKIGKGVPEIEQRKKKLNVPSLTVMSIGKGGPPPPIGGMDKPPSKPPEMPEPPGDDMGAAPDNDDYGAKLTQDIISVGQKHGMDPEKMKAVSADLFDAVAKCLRGAGSGDDGGTGYGESASPDSSEDVAS